MDPKDTGRGPFSDDRVSGSESLSTQVSSDVEGNEPAKNHARYDGKTNENNNNGASRAGSTATAVETARPPTDKMDRIETAPTHGSQEPPPQNHSLADTVEKAAHTAKKKLVLHHRHQRKHSEHFSAASSFKHLPGNKHKAPRKGGPDQDPEAQLEPTESQGPTVWQNFWVMLTTFPYWNMAFWSGWCYSIGSAMFVIDGAFAWTPVAFPETEFSGETEYAVPLLFFFGACLYQIGGVMAYLEAVNDGSFAGAAMKRLLEGHQDIEKELLDAKLHVFFGHIVPHHHNDDEHEREVEKAEQEVDPETGWKTLSKGDSVDHEALYDEAKERVERRGGVDHGPTEEGEVREYLQWQWWPTWHALMTYHIFELGYVACAIQLFGVTLYGVTSIVILPGILSSLEWWQELAAYWVPQVVASCCFLTASIMFTIMAQDKWYKWKPNAVSWWIGIWAQAGSVGFLLCALFGLVSHTHEWGEYQSSLSSTWGSFFYMMSGLFQWYEAINTNVGPVLAFPNNRTPVLLRHFHSSDH